MKCNKIYLGSDHGGFELKQELLQFLLDNYHEVIDIGTKDTMSVDYPDIAFELCHKLQNEAGTMGILICGSGIGMSIAANKVRGIRAALCSEPLSAKLSREHNDANVLCMGARIIGLEMAKEIVRVFLQSTFTGDRHIQRIQKISIAEE